MSELKNQNISNTLTQTRIRRQGQVCKTFEVKVQSNSMSNTQKEQINKLFLEAKWLYNNIISLDDSKNNFDTKTKQVIVLNKNKEQEERQLTVISSQIKQSVLEEIQSSIKGLGASKKKGRKVGKLKFKSECNSVNLKQHDVTYKIVGKNRIKIQGIKKPFKVNGLEQIKEGYELANAKFFRKSGGYYFKITCFINKEEIIKKKTGTSVGIDFGIKTDLTLSNGVGIDVKLPISKEIKRAHKRLSKKVKRSKNYWKARTELDKKYEYQNNVKKEIKCKLKNFFKEEFDHVGVQNESIKAWHHGWFGKEIQQSAIGGIIREMKKLSHTFVVDKFFPSTKLCPNCGLLNEIGLEERVYKCECGYCRPRDEHSACNILEESLNVRFDIEKKDTEIKNKENTLCNSNAPIPMGRRDFKPVEKTTAAFVNLVNNCKWISLSQEAPLL
jgi:transposase